MPRVVEAEREQRASRPRASSPSSGSSAFTTSSVSGQLGHRLPPALRDQLELAVAVELVAEEVAEQRSRAAARAARPRAARPRPPRTARAPRRVRGEQRRGDARDEVRPGRVVREPDARAQDLGHHRRGRRLAVRGRHERRRRGAAAPRAGRSRRGRPSIAACPGSVVPPPRRASRESAPTARAPRISTLRGRRAPIGAEGIRLHPSHAQTVGSRVLLVRAVTCVPFSLEAPTNLRAVVKLTTGAGGADVAAYALARPCALPVSVHRRCLRSAQRALPLLRGPEAQLPRGRGDRSRRARLVPGGDSQALHATSRSSTRCGRAPGASDARRR